MFKQAWRSFLASLHPRYLRKAYDKGGFFMLIYWFVIYPMIMNAVTENMEFYGVMALMLMRMIPFIMINWSNIGSKYLMPKVMFLSPMKEQERKEYINCVLLIKIGMCILLGTCIEIIRGCFIGFQLEKVFIMAIANFSIGVAEYITTEKKGINLFVTTMEIITIVIIAFLEIGTEGSLTIFCNWFILVSVILMPVLDIVIIRKKYHATIALAGEYEIAYKIEGKVEPKQVKFDLFAK